MKSYKLSPGGMFNNFFYDNTYGSEEEYSLEEQIGKWQDEEVKTLFKFVEIKKDEGMPLVQIFKSYAFFTKRQPNSVRNYYYKEIKILTADKTRTKRLKIDLSKHEAKNICPFDKIDAKWIIDSIQELIEQGYSVRGACLKIANGDVSLMVRYQNKYRSEMKNKKRLDNMGNIIKMPANPNVMSDEDINALFLGLIKLVKKQEMEKAKYYYQVELGVANEKLKEAMKEIVMKKAQIEKMRSEINLLKNKCDSLKERDVVRRIESTRGMTAKDAINKFVENGGNCETALDM